MEILSTSLNVCIPLFLLMALGYFLRQIGLIDSHFIAMANQLNFRVFLSLSIFSSLYNFKFDGTSYGSVILTSALTYLILGSVCILLVKKLKADNPVKGTMVSILFRSNYSYIGMPMVRTLCGAEGAAVAALLSLGIIPVGNVMTCVGYAVYCDKKVNYKNILVSVLKNPNVIATFLGVVCMLFNCPKLPSFISDPLDSLGSICTPLSMLTLGSSFDFSRLHQNKNLLVFGNLYRLIIIPAACILVFILAGFRGASLASLFALTASPTAIVNFTLADSMGGNSEIASQQIVTQSVLSIVTLFIWIYALKYFAFI